MDKFEEQIQAQKEELSSLHTRKDELREEYFKGRLEYEIQMDAIRHAEWISYEKQRLVERESRKAARLEERK